MTMTTAAPTSEVLPTSEFVDRLVTAERDCMVDWLNAMADLPGNPMKIAISRFGHATALVCGHIPAQIFNRVIGLTVADAEHVPAMLELYSQHGASPMFDLNPYAIPQFWVSPNVTPVLVKHGLYQGAFHHMLYASPVAALPDLPPDLSIREVGAQAADTFAQVYEQVWGDSTAVRVLIGKPQFRCYLAFVEDVPAALGVLHVANGTGSMANALTIPALGGHGCQTALLHRRIHDAHQMGCTLLVSQCSPGTTSQNNQMRAGFRIAGTKAWWVPSAAN